MTPLIDDEKLSMPLVVHVDALKVRNQLSNLFVDWLDSAADTVDKQRMLRKISTALTTLSVALSATAFCEPEMTSQLEDLLKNVEAILGASHPDKATALALARLLVDPSLLTLTGLEFTLKKIPKHQPVSAASSTMPSEISLSLHESVIKPAIKKIAVFKEHYAAVPATIAHITAQIESLERILKVNLTLLREKSNTTDSGSAASGNPTSVRDALQLQITELWRTNASLIARREQLQCAHRKFIEDFLTGTSTIDTEIAALEAASIGDPQKLAADAGMQTLAEIRAEKNERLARNATLLLTQLREANTSNTSGLAGVVRQIGRRFSAPSGTTSAPHIL